VSELFDALILVVAALVANAYRCGDCVVPVPGVAVIAVACWVRCRCCRCCYSVADSWCYCGVLPATVRVAAFVANVVLFCCCALRCLPGAVALLNALPGTLLLPLLYGGTLLFTLRCGVVVFFLMMLPIVVE